MVKLMKKVMNSHGYNDYVELSEDEKELYYEQMLKSFDKRGIKKDGSIRLKSGIEQGNKPGIKNLPKFLLDRIPEGWIGRLFGGSRITIRG